MAVKADVQESLCQQKAHGLKDIMDPVRQHLLGKNGTCDEVIPTTVLQLDDKATLRNVRLQLSASTLGQKPGRQMPKLWQKR